MEVSEVERSSSSSDSDGDMTDMNDMNEMNDKTSTSLSLETLKVRKKRGQARSARVDRLMQARVGIHENMEPAHTTVGIRRATGQKDPRGDVTDFVTREEDSTLVHVDYPAIVQNPSNALRTLGGPVKVSEVFQNSNKRLELRFRPADPFCNPLHGSGRTTVGILVKVRRRKLDPAAGVSKDKVPEGRKNLINLDEEQEDLEEILKQLGEEEKIPTVQVPVKRDLAGEGKSGDGNAVEGGDAAGGKDSLEDGGDVEESSDHLHTPFIKKLLEEERDLQREIRIENEDDKFEFTDNDGKSEFLGGVKTVVKLPRGNVEPPKSNFRIQAVGVVTKSYEFTGMSDFQYLPTIAGEGGGQVSICENIFPGFGNPDSGFLYDYEEPGGKGEKKFFPFSLPRHLCRVDKPITHMPKSYYADDGSIATQDNELGRGRRSVYTKMINFNQNEDSESEEVQIPTEPYPQALEDAAKKFYNQKQLDCMRKLFNQRPVWTKLALQSETKYSTESLKFLLPCVAYFTLNGPWRSLWIRFGYDPRRDKTAFVYQLIDFRFPVEYRAHMDIDQDDRESYHKFKPDTIPPKGQMFYQLCDIKLPEIEELQGALTVRLNNSEDIVCDPKHGFVDENVLEFCRYCMSRCMEVRLYNLGKIPAVKLPPIKLEPGGLIPVHQLKVKHKKSVKKRLRTSTGGRNRHRKSAVPEVEDVSYDFVEDLESSTGQNLTDFFDDDEELEEEDVEMYDGIDAEGGEGTSRNVDTFLRGDDDAAASD